MSYSIAQNMVKKAPKFGAFLLLTVFRFFEDGELRRGGGFVRWDFAGLAGLKKMLHGVWGRELAQDNVRSTPYPDSYRDGLRLDRLEGVAHSLMGLFS